MNLTPGGSNGCRDPHRTHTRRGGARGAQIGRPAGFGVIYPEKPALQGSPEAFKPGALTRRKRREYLPLVEQNLD